ncbi:MAG: glycosyltransferase family 2 protein [bacterium]|jgi:glycosyltransferase involved in cell wall biosynthesis
MASPLSALIITFNEEENIYRILKSIEWIERVLVVDSGSTDDTVKIIKSFRNATVIFRKFDTFAKQCNFGLDCLDSDWVLSLDSDYVVTKSLAQEIQSVILKYAANPDSGASGYSISFKYCVNGKPLRSGLLPPRICLYKRILSSYIDEGHGHRIIVNGSICALYNKMLHDDRKPISVWLDNQKRYQAIEARMLKESSSTKLPVQDLIRKHTFLAPFASFFISLIIKGGILDGKEGILYAFQRLVAESILYLNMHVKNPHRSKDGQ